MDASGSDRDNAGRFAPGHAKLGGRRAGQSLSAELRRQADVEAIARRLLAIIADPRTNAREVLGAIALVFDRLEGKSIARTVSMRVGAASILPPGFEGLSPEAKHAVLVDLRARALAGEIGVTDD